MVVKHCPACGEKLAVAVKSCPCGYIFMARKSSGKPIERKVEICGDRLRPDRLKKDGHREDEFYYHGMVKIGNVISDENTSKYIKRNDHVGKTETDEIDDDNTVTKKYSDNNTVIRNDSDDDTFTEKYSDNNTITRRYNDNNTVTEKHNDYNTAREKYSLITKEETCASMNENFRLDSSSLGSNDFHGEEVVSENPNEMNSDLTPVRKRGRPKGSKDKKKRLPKGYKEMHPAELVSMASTASSTRTPPATKTLYYDSIVSKECFDGPSMPRRRGRPRGSKTKVRSPSILDSRKSDDEAEESDERKERYVAARMRNQTYHIPSEKKETFSLILDDINYKIVGQAWRV